MSEDKTEKKTTLVYIEKRGGYQPPESGKKKARNPPGSEPHETPPPLPSGTADPAPAPQQEK
jgi:hypothetical protein